MTKDFPQYLNEFGPVKKRIYWELVTPAWILKGYIVREPSTRVEDMKLDLLLNDQWKTVDLADGHCLGQWLIDDYCEANSVKNEVLA